MFRLFIPLFLLFSCKAAYKTHVNDYRLAAGAPDYSHMDYWAAHPWKKDASDSLPSAIEGQAQDTLADVFFIHPTTYTKKRKNWNASFGDRKLNAKTDYTTILYQASVFNQHARVFAPRYRQVHLKAFFVKNAITQAAFDTAYSDVRQAFLYYLLHYNNGRPVIIAGHSQGAMMAERLLKEFFDGKQLQEQLVAAYVVGWPIPSTLFSTIPVCTDSLQTGCVCGWRTLKTDFIPVYIRHENTPSFITNPLSWDTTSTMVPASRNLGSVLRNFNLVYQHTTGATIHKGILWVTKPKFPGSLLFTRRNYHIADINLFYMNLRQNIQQRINQYYHLHQ